MKKKAFHSQATREKLFAVLVGFWLLCSTLIIAYIVCAKKDGIESAQMSKIFQTKIQNSTSESQHENGNEHGFYHTCVIFTRTNGQNI